MPLAAAGIMWTGYTFVWWGWRLITKGERDLMALIVPGRAFASSGSSSSSSSPGGGTASKGPLPGLGGGVPYGAPGFPAGPASVDPRKRGAQ